jgi:hypothetical protein
MPSPSASQARFWVIAKTLACRALDGGQAGNVILCGRAKCHFHGGKYRDLPALNDFPDR